MIYGTFLNKETLLSLESFLDIFAQPWDEESTQSEGTVKYWTTDPYRAGPSSNYFAIWRNKRCQLDSLSRPELQMKTNLLKSTAPCQMQICASRSLSNAKSLTNRGQTRHYQSPGVSSETMNTGSLDRLWPLPHTILLDTLLDAVLQLSIVGLCRPSWCCYSPLPGVVVSCYFQFSTSNADPGKALASVSKDLQDKKSMIKGQLYKSKLNLVNE